jgi:hypothetical protein
MLWKQAAAAPCSPEDVSIVQDNAFNDMASSFVQVSRVDEHPEFLTQISFTCPLQQIRRTLSVDYEASP